MQQRFAQISDPHLSSLEGVRTRDLLSKRALGYLSWRRRRRFEHRSEVLQALQQDLDLTELEQLLITGDLTHIGLPSEFRQAAHWLQQFGESRQLALVPGNHDACVRANWDDTYALWRDYMDSDQPAADRNALFPNLRIRGQLAFIGLSTACPKPPVMATGTIDAGQLQRLPGILRKTGERDLFRVVYLHHCPLPGLERWRKRLTNAEEVSGVIAEAGVELVLHGHGHRTHRHEMVTGDGVAPVIAVPSASALGLHGADPASYNRYTVTPTHEGWRLEVSSRRYDPQHDHFADSGKQVLDIRRPERRPSPGNP